MVVFCRTFSFKYFLTLAFPSVWIKIVRLFLAPVSIDGSRVHTYPHSFGKFFESKYLLKKLFEGGMLGRTKHTTFLQLFCESLLHS